MNNKQMLNLIRRSKPSSLSSLTFKTPPFKAPHPSPPSQSSTTAASSLLRRLLSPSISPPFENLSRRSYYTARPSLHHFRRRQYPPWYQNPRIIFIIVLVGGGSTLTLYYGNLETVPYTKRSHFVLLSPSVERQLGEAQFNELKSTLRGKILPPIHPDSIRVRLISKQIIEAVQRGFTHGDRRWIEIDKASEQAREVRWSEEDDQVLDDEWVRDSRKEGKARGSNPATRHLEGLDWEVLVVRDEMVNAMCLPGGKIIVFTGLLDHFRTDAEIATVIGHEVGCFF